MYICKTQVLKDKILSCISICVVEQDYFYIFLWRSDKSHEKYLSNDLDHDSFAGARQVADNTAMRCPS